MTFKALASTALVASLSFAPVSPFVTPARADGKDVVAGLIIGGIIGGAIASENGKKKKKTTSKSKTKSKSKSKSTKSSAPAVDPAIKAANVEVQQALNHFGWAVGTADGALGPKSKAAIKEYQGFLGFPVSGELTEYERSVLVTAYHRAEAGGTAISEIVSSSVYGLRGVLIAQNDEMKGVVKGSGDQMAAAPISPDPVAKKPGEIAAAAAAAIPVLLPDMPADVPTVTAPAGSIVASPEPAPEPAVIPQPEPKEEVAVVAPEPAPLPVLTVPEPVAEPEDVASAEEAEPAEPEKTGPGLPTFLSAGAGAAIGTDCNATSLATAANGGLTTMETLTDADFALSEQFCLARGEAITMGADLAAGITGFTPAQISEQCAALAPLLSGYVGALPTKEAEAVLVDVQGFVQGSGMQPEQLAGTMRVCLGVGYDEGKMDVAVGSALVLTALGETGYAELVGHHLGQGYSTGTAQPELAEVWYDMAATAIADGQPVFAKDAAGRGELILAASHMLTGNGAPAAPGLPSFMASPEPTASPEVAPAAVVGPGADAIRAGAEVAKSAAQLPLLLLTTALAD